MSEHPSGWNGGVLSTAGGLASGRFATGYSRLRSRHGVKLWSYPVRQGIVAPPITYSVDGEQYVALLSGWGGVYALLTGEIARQHSVAGGKGRILAFRLGGAARLPARSVDARVPAALPDPAGDATTIEAGMRLYQRYCGGCHGSDAVSGGVLPDLRMSTLNSSPDAWARVVRDGVLADRGMVGFGSSCRSVEVEAIRAFVVKRARETLRTADD